MTKVLSLFRKYSIIRPVLKIAFPWFLFPLLLVPCSPLMFCLVTSQTSPFTTSEPLFHCSTPTAPLHSQQDSPPLLTEDAPGLTAFSNPQNHSWSTLGLILPHLSLSEQPHHSCLLGIAPLLIEYLKAQRNP